MLCISIWKPDLFCRSKLHYTPSCLWHLHRDLHSQLAYQVCEKGEKIAILALGDFFAIGQKTAKYIEDKTSSKVTLINPRFASGVDKELLDELIKTHDVIVTLEDGILEGGFGQKIASYLGSKDVKVLNYGFEKKFYDAVPAPVVLEECRITPEKIFEDISSC